MNARTLEAAIDETGNVRLIEPVRLPRRRRALVVVLDEDPVQSGYEMLSELGAGGMGQTFRARERSSGRVVCVKRLRAGIDASALEQEFRALVRLEHPNIVGSLAFDRDAQGAFLVMEYIEGRPLSTWLRTMNVPLRPSVSCTIAAGIFDALAHAAAREIIHCDLKPANVMIEFDGTAITPKVLDFGLAVVDRVDDRNAITGEGRIAGTPQYMAPEQLQARRLSSACDVYACAVMLWEMIAGGPAFVAGSGDIVSQLYAKMNAPDGLAVTDRIFSVPLAVKELIRRCTAHAPDSRPGAAEAARVLRESYPAANPPVVLSAVNLRFQGALADKGIPGWFDGTGLVDGVSKRYVADPNPGGVRLEGRNAGASEFGVLMQSIPVADLAGFSVCLEAGLATQGVTGRAGLWLRVDGEQGFLSLDNMSDRPVSGNTTCTRYRVLATLPPGARWLNYGVLLAGPGTVWLDDLRLFAFRRDCPYYPLELWPEAETVRREDMLPLT